MQQSDRSYRPRVMVLGAGDRPHVIEQAAGLRPHLEAAFDIAVWDLHQHDQLDDVEADLAIVLGGDGSILRAALQMGYHQRPVVGVNLGKLGFLADLSPERLLQVLPDLCQQRYRVINHLMFECTLYRGEQRVFHALGLNEVAVLAGAPFRMLEVHLYIDSELVTTYSADGLIVSTPVGSTAHSLSAGGPILRKDLQAFVVNPVCPHTLTNRPVVDSADREYELVVPRPNEQTSVVLDGRVQGTLEPGDRLRVVRAQPVFQLIEVSGSGYYRTLREKLGWGGTMPRNGP